jgi:signal transduction histidine kinase
MESPASELQARASLFPHRGSMVTRMKSGIAEILDQRQTEILADWLKEPGNAAFEKQARAVLAALRTATRNGDIDDVGRPEFAELRDLVASICRSRASSKPSETAAFIFSLKRPLFVQLGRSVSDAQALERELWAVTALIDALALHAIDASHKSREEIVAREPEVLSPSAADIAHDFNNLLAGIIGGINVVRGRIAKGQTDDIARFMDEIVNSAHRAASLTQELLASAQLQVRESEPTMRPSGEISPKPGANDIEGL